MTCQEEIANMKIAMQGTIDRKPLVMALDDEPDILELLRVNLEKAGMEISTHLSPAPFITELETRIPDAIVLDIMLPDMDGLEICKRIRGDERIASVPILFLTARGDELDIILGLELGGDDYMVKPFSPKELIARLKAILRRSRSKKKEPETLPRIGGMEIDSNRHEVRIGEQKINLTATEFDILKILAQKPGWVFSRQMILDRLWGDEKDVLDRTIDVHIKNLREKLGPAGRLVQSIRGVGYKLEE